MILSERAQRFASMADYTAEIEDANAQGVAGVPGDGPYVVLKARIVNGMVEAIAYESHGCPSVRAAAACVCWLAKGREAQKLLAMTAADILSVLGGLPEGKEDSAVLASASAHHLLEKANAKRSSL